MSELSGSYGKSPSKLPGESQTLRNASKIRRCLLKHSNPENHRALLIAPLFVLNQFQIREESRCAAGRARENEGERVSSGERPILHLSIPVNQPHSTPVLLLLLELSSAAQFSEKFSSRSAPFVLPCLVMHSLLLWGRNGALARVAVVDTGEGRQDSEGGRRGCKWYITQLTTIPINIFQGQDNKCAPPPPPPLFPLSHSVSQVSQVMPHLVPLVLATPDSLSIPLLIPGHWTQAKQRHSFFFNDVRGDLELY